VEHDKEGHTMMMMWSSGGWGGKCSREEVIVRGCLLALRGYFIKLFKLSIHIILENKFY
jgi:hypothetical protein